MSSGRIKPDEPQTPGSDLTVPAGVRTVRNGQAGRLPHHRRGAGLGRWNRDRTDPDGERTERLLALRIGIPGAGGPASPPLAIEEGPGLVRLDWSWRGSSDPDPLAAGTTPARFSLRCPIRTGGASTRRPATRPEAGSSRIPPLAKRIPEFDPASFSLIRQYDVDDDLRFEFGTGLEFTFTDSNLLHGKKYWYAVTSFGIPGVTVNVIPLPDNPGSYRIDTLYTAPLESALGRNATLVQLPFSPSSSAGRTIVVPNPTGWTVITPSSRAGGKAARSIWNEWKRTIWFIHLPPTALIRIFSLTGDIVATIHHDDGGRTEPAGPGAGGMGYDERERSGHRLGRLRLFRRIRIRNPDRNFRCYTVPFPSNRPPTIPRNHE